MTRVSGFIRMAAMAGFCAVALGLAACSPPAGDSGAGGKKDDLGSSLSSSFDKSFNESFAKGAKDSCTKSAVASGAPATKAEAYCTCFVDQLAPLSVQEKTNLRPDSEVVKNAATACKDKAL